MLRPAPTVRHAFVQFNLTVTVTCYGRLNRVLQHGGVRAVQNHYRSLCITAQSARLLCSRRGSRVIFDARCASMQANVRGSHKSTDFIPTRAPSQSRRTAAVLAAKFVHFSQKCRWRLCFRIDADRIAPSKPTSNNIRACRGSLAKPYAINISGASRRIFSTFPFGGGGSICIHTKGAFAKCCLLPRGC